MFGNFDQKVRNQPGPPNQVWAGPVSGSPYGPAVFRALVAADIPNIAESQVTNLTSDLAGKSPLAGSSSIVTVGTITSGTWNGTTIAIANGGTGQTSAAAAYNALSPMTTLGDIEYESGANTASRLAGNTTSTKKFLTQTGTGSVSAAPGWNTIAAADVPTMVASGGSHAAGLVPDPGSTAGTQKFLREDATWAVTPGAQELCNGRITITSGNAAGVDALAAGTLYFTPYLGNQIGLYNGSTWDVLTFSETSLAVPATGGVHDLFAYNNSGTLALEALVWTNSTTRATALTKQDGVYVKSGATTRRYLGSFWSNSNNTDDYPTRRLVWNYYNRLTKAMQTAETGNWTYSTAAWRLAKNDAANQLFCIVGVKEDTWHGCAGSFGVTIDASYFSANIGYDAAASVVGLASFRTGGAATGIQCGTVANMDHQPDAGLHSYWWVEYAEVVGANPVTFYTADSRFNSGMTIQARC